MHIMDGYRSVARLVLVVALVGVEVWLARDLGATSGVVGYTQTHSHTVAPPRRAKVRSLAVQLGDSVTAGQLIAELDPTEIDNEIEAAKTARDRAGAALQAALTKLRRASVDTARRFDTSTERATAELATADANAKTAAAELDAVEREIEEQRALVKGHLADSSLLKSLELRRAALAKQVASAEKVLTVLTGNLAAATKRAAGVAEGDDGDDAMMSPLRAELEAAELHLRQLERERAALALHAPVDGVIDQLPLHPGDLAGPEVPVATVVAADTMRVVACVPESRASSVAIGQEAELTTVFDRVSGSGVVESVTSEIAPLPARCQSGFGKAPAMGRLAVVALDGPVSRLPGQTQIVRFQARRRPHRAQATSSPALPVNLRVPSQLLARTRFEPSGLVWVAALDRYVIASDDTGFEDRSEHVPWLFTMTARGEVDPDPLVVDGIDKLADVEAIAAGADSSLWLLSSASMSRNGKRSAARQRLVRVELRGAKAQVTGSVELAELLDRASPEQRAALGITDTRDLDVEAIAVLDGALYIGLKAPVDAADLAQIWRVADPDKLLAGDLAGAQMTLWSRLKMTVDADGRTVAAGIADMAFAGPSTLLVAATASGIDPGTQSGALYVARLEAGSMEPTRVRTFAGLKPEGIAITPEATKLAVVFDQGADPAVWIELPLDPLTREGVRGAK